MMRIPSRKRCATGWPVALCCFVMIGCNGETGTRHQISGTVTFQGKPVEHGTIAFDPEESVGTGFAPSSYAHIENGKYSTVRDESPTTGRYRVRVSAFDMEKMQAKAVPGEPTDPIPLFPPYLTTVQVPPPEGKFDVEIPAGPAARTGR